MRFAYIEEKDFRDLYLGFTLLFGSRFVHVYIWKSVRGLKRNTYFQNKDYLGAYVYYPNRKPRSGLFGEIHLIKWMIGAGYVAHEIQHFLYDWLREQRLTSRTNEVLALLAGNFTKEFWNQYYKRSEKMP